MTVALPLFLIGCALLLVGLCVRDAPRTVLRRLRGAADDDPIGDASHRCPICYDLDADEANGILRTDFELWESEWTP